MLSRETEEMICNIFSELINHETQIENQKKIFDDIPSIYHELLFKKLEEEKYTYISSNKIVYFLKKYSINCTDNEIKSIIKLYDIDKDNHLNYKEFLHLILSSRKKIESYNLKYSEDNNSIKNLPYEFEYEFCKLLEIQLSLVRILEKLLFDLKKRKDFSIYDLYNELKDENKDEISFIKLSNFMKRNIKSSNNEELRLLFKKLDINKDYSVTMDDICVIFGKDIFNSQIYSYDDLNNNNNVELIGLINKEEEVSQNLLVEFFLLLLEVEKISELEKIELCSKSDFNIDDVLNIFQKNNPNYISASELKNGLNNLGIIANNGEVELLIKKYNTNDEFVIDNSDFFDMLVPFDKNYREIVEKRKPLPYLKNKEIIFSDLTRQSLVNFFKIIISCEITLEKKRKYLRKNVNINLNNFYNMIDIENKGFICINDFFRFFSSLNSEIETKYIYLLFLRIDRKKIGIIEQIDLMNEILPKIPFI